MATTVQGEDVPTDDELTAAAAASLQALGQQSVAVDHNAGAVLTGAGAQVRIFGSGVTLGSPATIAAPPGGLFSLPRPATKMFVGRDDELAELDRLMDAGAGVITQAVHGLGGVGKSELASRYATLHQSRYAVVWWLVAQDPSQIEAGLSELAFHLHPDLRLIATQSEAAAWALGWLGSHDRWLLIIDNVEDHRDVEPVLGRLSRGHVLITSRRDIGWEDITDGCVRLEVLSLAEAVELLARLSGPADLDTARTLAGELSCLPLALQQAGAYMRQTRTSETRYLERLRANPDEMLDQVAAGGDAERAVFRTWSLTVATIADQDPFAVLLLQILSCYAPEHLPRDVLDGLDVVGDVDAALGILASFNMIILTRGMVTVHRLVQVVTLSQLRQAPPDLDEVIRTSVHVLLESIPPGKPETDVATWPRWAELVPHVVALATVCPDDVGGPSLAALLAKTARFEGVQGRHRLALAFQERAVHTLEAAFGSGHPAVATVLSDFAVSLFHLGRPAEAIPILRRVLTMDIDAHGEAHPETAATLTNLAACLDELGRAREAETLHRQALAIAETTLGPDHPDVANRLGNLAATLNSLGAVAEGESLHRRALGIIEGAVGPEHPDTARGLNNLATTLRRLGRVHEAVPLQRRAIAITEAQLGPEHPVTAITVDNLALDLCDLGRAREAEPLHRRALAITETALGLGHPEVADRLTNLAGCLEELERTAEAEPLFRRALAIVESTREPDHPAIADSVARLAGALTELGRTVEAEALHRRALSLSETLYGPEASNVADRLGELAFNLDQQEGRSGEAESLHRRAVAIAQSLGTDNKHIARKMAGLVVNLKKQGRTAEAEELRRQALEILGLPAGEV